MQLISLFYKIILLFALFTNHPLLAKENQTVTVSYLTQTLKPPAVLSNLDPFITDKGVKGAELGIEDNNTTGQYTKQRFLLEKIVVPAEGDVVGAFNKLLEKKRAFVITSLPPDTTNKLADLANGKDVVILDAGTIDDASRNKACHANVLHVLPSRAMRADALAQYLLKKRWTKWFLVVGSSNEDKQFAEALEHAAKKFGLTIVETKVWEHTFDARRTAQADVAVFTQVDDYDVLVVADEAGVFGEYLPYRTWLSRPVIGTQGLIATAWHNTHEQWGASQIQNRFKEKANRWMDEFDYAAYLATRAIGEAAVRTKTNALKPVLEYMLGDQFALQGYKGVALSFRTWDHQLRQPVLLAAPRSMVAIAPIEGFLHPKTELDTLGYDQPETQCQWNQKN